MAPHKTIMIRDIVLRAMDLIRKEGTDNVTARKIAIELGCSTMPIYSSLGSMKDLNRRIIELGYVWLGHLQAELKTGHPLTDLEMSMMILARREPHLWKLMFLYNEPAAQEVQFCSWREITQEIADAHNQNNSNSTISVGEIRTIGYSIFGSCAAIALGSFFYHTDEPENLENFFLDFFHSLNEKNLPNYSATPLIPKDIDQILDSTLQQVQAEYHPD